MFWFPRRSLAATLVELGAMREAAWARDGGGGADAHETGEKGGGAAWLWARLTAVVARTMLALRPLLAANYHLCFGDRWRGGGSPGGGGGGGAGTKGDGGAAGRARRDTSLRTFQILGFDVMLRADFAPVLLEVNNNPSMSMGYKDSEGRHVTSAVARRRFAEHFYTFRVGGTDPHRPSTPQIGSQRLCIRE